MIALGQDTLHTRRTLSVGGRSYEYFSLPAAAEAGLGDIARLPFSLKVLLENLLRFEDGRSVSVEDIRAVGDWVADGRGGREIAYRPARVLMQDFTGVPAVVDLAAMRAAMTALGGDASRINPLSPVDLVIDHSVMVDHFGTTQAFGQNVSLEMARNGERYAFLRWGQQAFENFRVVPPGTGICHQVNLEYLAQVVWTDEVDGTTIAYPDTLVGTDSHTTMVNGLAVLGWGVGGIEAEAAMLGQPISMLLPDVVGFKLSGRLREGATATDLVLTVTQMLRAHGVVGKFVEFFGPGLDDLGLADRATIANMAPEYGATCGFFPIDGETINYLNGSAREPERIALVEAYAKAQGMWREPGTPDPVFTDILELDLDQVEPSIAGPKRPQDKIALSDAKPSFAERAGVDIRRRWRCREPARAGGRHRPRPQARRCGDRGDYELHQHLEPQRNGGRRAARPQRGRPGPQRQALGQNLARAGLQGGLGLPRERRAAGRPRHIGFQPRRLRLHDLHRQLGAAGAADSRGRGERRPGGLLRALR